MARVTIVLDEQEQARLEQAVIDKDGKEALKLLAEIRERVKAGQTTRCGIEKLRK